MNPTIFSGCGNKFLMAINGSPVKMIAGFTCGHGCDGLRFDVMIFGHNRV